MPDRRHQRLFVLACLAVVAAFSFAVVEASASHTDDGCQVELHCFACHWAFAGTAILALPVTLRPALHRAGPVVPIEAPRPVEPPVPGLCSRGPPLGQ